MAGVLHMESWTEESANIIFEQAPKVDEPSSETEEEINSESQSGEESESQPEQEGTPSE